MFQTLVCVAIVTQVHILQIRHLQNVNRVPSVRFNLSNSQPFVFLVLLVPLLIMLTDLRHVLHAQPDHFATLLRVRVVTRVPQVISPQIRTVHFAYPALLGDIKMFQTLLLASVV